MLCRQGRVAGSLFELDMLLTAVSWIAPMPPPHRVFAEVGEAAAYAREQEGSARAVERPTGT